MKFKIVTIIGARPQIIKAAALSRAIRSSFSERIEEVLVHTGQHYDANMSATFFQELEIPEPAYNLGVGSGPHGAQTAKMLAGIEVVLQKEQPNAVIVYGDTNSTLAAGIAASKLGIPVVHIEAGLRSFNKEMPEEINRIVCDHVSTLLFSPTHEGVRNLEAEGFDTSAALGKAHLNRPKVFHCGDIMYDNSMYFATKAAAAEGYLSEQGLISGRFALVTIHRNNNTDDAERLTAIWEAILQLAEKEQHVFAVPLHPRTRKMMENILAKDLMEKLSAHTHIHLMEPASYLQMIALEQHCNIVLTDSGGVQKEAYFFQKPCIILRPETEWVELVQNGNAVLTDAHTNLIIQSYERLSKKTDYTWPSIFGDGNAASFICNVLLIELNS